jgi:uncharacterized phage protein gp47/JayE
VHLFEHQTYEALLERMLSRVKGDVDKEPGSIIYDAVAPASLELAQIYSDLDVTLRLVFAKTSSGEFLANRTSENGIFKEPATYAVRKGFFKNTLGLPIDVEIGSRFRLNGVTYVATEKIALGEFKLKAELSGEVGNQDFGTLIPINSIDNLGSADLADVLARGKNEESDESLKKRYEERNEKPSTSGNAAHYEEWAREVPGVGDAKAIPLWNGKGTVKVIILGENKRSPDSSIVEAVRIHIESKRPIGAIVTVVGATEVPINISAAVTLANGKQIPEATTEVNQSVSRYFESLAFVDPVIRYAQAGSILLEAPSVLDYSNLKINNATVNIQLPVDSIAVVGAVLLT